MYSYQQREAYNLHTEPNYMNYLESKRQGKSTPEYAPVSSTTAFNVDHQPIHRTVQDRNFKFDVEAEQRARSMEGLDSGAIGVKNFKYGFLSAGRNRSTTADQVTDRGETTEILKSRYLNLNEKAYLASGLGYGPKHRLHYDYRSQKCAPRVDTKTRDIMAGAAPQTRGFRDISQYKRSIAHSLGYGSKHPFATAYLDFHEPHFGNPGDEPQPFQQSRPSSRPDSRRARAE
jgi:hypothetical protein